jgi:hypothetical protein
MRPASYCTTDSCVNCRHVFTVWNPETWEGYCAFGCSRQRVRRLYDNRREGRRQSHAFFQWGLNRSVDQNGICDEYGRPRLKRKNKER